MHGDFGFSCEGDADSHSERERSDIHEDEQDLQVSDTEEEERPCRGSSHNWYQ